jgi:hypothetical protein
MARCRVGNRAYLIDASGQRQAISAGRARSAVCTRRDAGSGVADVSCIARRARATNNLVAADCPAHLTGVGEGRGMAGRGAYAGETNREIAAAVEHVARGARAEWLLARARPRIARIDPNTLEVALAIALVIVALTALFDERLAGTERAPEIRGAFARKETGAADSHSLLAETAC